MNIPEWKIPITDPGRSSWAGLESKLSPDAESRNALSVVGIDAARTTEVFRTAPAKYLYRLSIRAGDKIVLISVREVVWVQSHGNLLRLHLQHASYEHRTTMKEISHQLDPAHFLRIHRNAIVNLDHVVEFTLPRCGNAFVHMRNGKMLPISGVARVALRRGLLNWSCASADTDES